MAYIPAGMVQGERQLAGPLCEPDRKGAPRPSLIDRYQEFPRNSNPNVAGAPARALTSAYSRAPSQVKAMKEANEKRKRGSKVSAALKKEAERL